MRKSILTYTALCDLLDYDPLEGVFRWKQDRLSGNGCAVIPAGTVAGHLHKKGYIYIGLGGSIYGAHRLAWLYVYGEWPRNQIDHVNGVKSDNRISNLRDVSASQNAINRPIRRDNSSGSRGVRFYTPLQKWNARIAINGERKHLGYFERLEDAEAAYRSARDELHREFARND